MNLLIVLAIIAVLVLIISGLLIAAWLDQRPGRAGGRPILGNVIDRFTVKPDLVPVGEATEFVFKSQANNPLATGTQLRPVVGRRVLFVAGPSPVVIQSVNGVAVNGESADGVTDANGLISVVLIARDVPEIGPKGALVAQATARGGKRLELDFDVE